MPSSSSSLLLFIGSLLSERAPAEHALNQSDCFTLVQT